VVAVVVVETDHRILQGLEVAFAEAVELAGLDLGSLAEVAVLVD